MARSHGRFSHLYVAITSGGTASPLLHTGTFEISLTTDKVDVTAHGDTVKQYVAGLPDGPITFSGFATDTAGTSLVESALDGVARAWYLYPFNSTSIYMYGTGFCSFSLGTDVQGAVTMSGDIAQATALGRVGF